MELAQGLHQQLYVPITGSGSMLTDSLRCTAESPTLTSLPHSNGVMELARGVRSQLQALVSGLAGADLTPMSLGLSHSLSRYKLKFSPDKVRARRSVWSAFSACWPSRSTGLQGDRHGRPLHFCLGLCCCRACSELRLHAAHAARQGTCKASRRCFADAWQGRPAGSW